MAHGTVLHKEIFIPMHNIFWTNFPIGTYPAPIPALSSFVSALCFPTLKLFLLLKKYFDNFILHCDVCDYCYCVHPSVPSLIPLQLPPTTSSSPKVPFLPHGSLCHLACLFPEGLAEVATAVVSTIALGLSHSEAKHHFTPPHPQLPQSFHALFLNPEQVRCPSSHLQPVTRRRDILSSYKSLP